MSEFDSKGKQGQGAQTPGRTGSGLASAEAPGKRTLTMDLPASAEDAPSQARSSAEGMQSALVQPALASITPSSASARAPTGDREPSASGSEARSSSEGKPPEQTETEKRSYMAASTPVSRDLSPSGSSGLTEISMSDVAITGEVYDDGGTWKIRVTAASTRIHWGITTSGYQVPNPTDGGNITQANYQDVIRELAGYEARQASGSWHVPRASEVHELDHVSWYQGEITRTWTTIETTITTHTLGSSRSVSRAAAETAMNTYLNTQRRAWFDAYGLAPEPRAYAAGQAVLDGVITQIRTYATSKGWTGGGSGSGSGSGTGAGTGSGSGSGSGSGLTR